LKGRLNFRNGGKTDGLARFVLLAKMIRIIETAKCRSSSLKEAHFGEVPSAVVWLSRLSSGGKYGDIQGV
jgi:hypothetical protein